MASGFNQQAQQQGKKALADQGKAVKQTAVNYSGLAPAPGAPPPPPAQTRDRPFAQGQAAYQQGAPRGPGMMPMAPGVAKPPPPVVKTGRVGNLPTTFDGSVPKAPVVPTQVGSAYGTGAAGAAPRQNSAIATLASMRGIGQNMDQRAGAGMAQSSGYTPKPYGSSSPPPPPMANGGTGAVLNTGGILGKHDPSGLAGTQGQAMAGQTQNAFHLLEPGEQVEDNSLVGNGTTGGQLAGQTFGNIINGLVGGAGGPLNDAASMMSRNDAAAQDDHYGDVNQGLVGQDALARGEWNSDARAKAEAAARTEMQTGLDSQRASQMRELAASAGRGGNVSQGQGNAVNNSAAMAQAAGERGLTMDAAERQRQATQDLLNVMQGTTDRRKEMRDETFTSKKDLLALAAKMATPFGFGLGSLN